MLYFQSNEKCISSEAPLIQSKICASNSERLDIGTTQHYACLQSTMDVLRHVHTNSNQTEEERQTSIKDGLFVTTMKQFSSKQLIERAKTSKKLTKVITCKRSNMTVDELNKKMFERSVNTLYTGKEPMSVETYQGLKNYENSHAVDIPLLSYRNLIMQINRLHVSQLKATPLPDINGCKRDLTELLLAIARMYIVTETVLKWLGEEGTFCLIAGGHVAHMGNDDETTFLISFLNVVHLVASPKHNFLYLGGCVHEDDQLYLAYVREFATEMKEIEKKLSQSLVKHINSNSLFSILTKRGWVKWVVNFQILLPTHLPMEMSIKIKWEI